MSKFFPEKITILSASELQEQFHEELILEDEIPVNLETIGGVTSYSRGSIIKVAMSILKIKDNYSNFEILKQDFVEDTSRIPELPTFGGFREGRVIADTITSFDIPDILMIKGHGLNHPRKFGIACHVGLSMNIATIAVSTELLCGEVKTIDGKNLIMDDEEIVGEVVKKTATSPRLYVSPGHRVSVETAAEDVRKTTLEKIPEPLRIANEELVKRMSQK
nr:endonuclease V [Candidatus Undinarchaeales archaeon ERR594346 U_76725]